MFITQLHQSYSTQNPFLLHSHKAFIDCNSNGKGNGNASRTISVHHSFHKKAKCVGVRSMASNIKAVASTTDDEEASSVKAIITVKSTIGGLLSNLGIERGLDDIKDLLGETLVLELVSTELDPSTGFEKDTIKGYAHRTSQEEAEVKYESNFEVPIDFGQIGAVLVENEHHKEMYLQDIILNGCPNGPVRVNCNSWVHSKYDNPQKRVFFANKQSYLPSQTPRGLRKLREEELWILQGSGQGERRSFERVYDYDTYNDLGDPDTSVDLKRPVLGGKEHPYPRRCRTGPKPKYLTMLTALFMFSTILNTYIPPPPPAPPSVLPPPPPVPLFWPDPILCPPPPPPPPPLVFPPFPPFRPLPPFSPRPPPPPPQPLSPPNTTPPPSKSSPTLYVPLGILSLTIGLAAVFAIAHYTRPRSEEENPERTTEPQNTNGGVPEPHELGGVTVTNVPTRLARLPDPIGSPALALRVAV